MGELCPLTYTHLNAVERCFTPPALVELYFLELKNQCRFTQNFSKSGGSNPQIAIDQSGGVLSLRKDSQWMFSTDESAHAHAHWQNLCMAGGSMQGLTRVQTQTIKIECPAEESLHDHTVAAAIYKEINVIGAQRDLDKCGNRQINDLFQ